MARFVGSFSYLAVSGAVALVGGCSQGGGVGVRGDGGTSSDAHVDAALASDAGGDAATRCVLRCGPLAACCSDGQECVVDRCLDLCAGSRCGEDDRLCCATNQLCVGGACIAPGVACVGDDECPPENFCEPLVGRCIPIPVGAECRYIPPRGVFEPEVQWEHTSPIAPGSTASETMYFQPPTVINTTDDNGDGRVDALDVPDVIIPGPPQMNPHGGLYDERSIPFLALSGDDGRELWRSPYSEWSVDYAGQAAAADVDDDGDIELVQLVHPTDLPSSPPRHVAMFDSRGVVEWVSAEPIPYRQAFVNPLIADLDEDGDGEIFAHGRVYDKNGTLLWSTPDLTIDDSSGGPRIFFGSVPVIADVDGDGHKELLTSHVAFRYDGTEYWRRPANIYQGYVAIGRFVSGAGVPDGPQIVAADDTRFQIIDARTGDSLLGPVSIGHAGGSGYPAALVVADFDGDGLEEFAMSRGSRFVVINPRLTTTTKILWEIEATPTTGRPGGTVFDFDADGAVEVVLTSYCTLRILKGADGDLIWYTSHANTNAVPYPVVADVDNDGNAELITYQNFINPTACTSGSDLEYQVETRSGLRVWRDRLDNWVPTRPIWNQANYHLDNISDDGELPRAESPSWSTHNTYRVQSLADPDLITLSPDLTVVSLSAETTSCPLSVRLRARIQNRGSRGVPAGVNVAFFAGPAGSRVTPLALGATTARLLSGEATWVEATATGPALAPDHSFEFYAVVDDDGAGRGAHSECHEDNNASPATTVDCSGPI